MELHRKMLADSQMERAISKKRFGGRRDEREEHFSSLETGHFVSESTPFYTRPGKAGNGMDNKKKGRGKPGKRRSGAQR